MSDSGTALRESLARAAAEERARIAIDADHRAAAAAERAEAEKAALREAAMERLERELAEQSEKRRGAARLAEEARVLALKRELIGEVFAAAAEKLTARTDDEGYRKTIARLAVEAAEALLASEPRGVTALPVGELRVRNADRAAVAAALSGAGLDGAVVLAANARTEDLPAGSVVAARSDGRLTVDNGFTSRLQRARERLLPDLAAALFSGDAG